MKVKGKRGICHKCHNIRKGPIYEGIHFSVCQYSLKTNKQGDLNFGSVHHMLNYLSLHGMPFSIMPQADAIRVKVQHQP